MSLCINPHCSKSNSDNVLFCQSCGSELLLEGRYRTIKLLGQGGFGKTYEVSDVRSNLPKVLKVLTDNQPKAVELFQREAQVLKILNYPGIPRVEQDGYFVYFPRASQQELHCLVMEKIEGMNLYDYLKQRENRPINQKLAVQWLKEIVNILQLVHEQNYFHRDIKPPNIMLRATGNLVLIDFGGAREATQTYYFAHQKANVTGLISVGYTPQEQMAGQAVPLSDFFALGRTFVFLLTGKEPNDPTIFNSRNGQMRWRDVVPDISPKFADLIDRMMAHFPNQRPGNTREILQALADIEQAMDPPRQSSQSKRSPSPASQFPPTEVNPRTPPTPIPPTPPTITPPTPLSNSATTATSQPTIRWGFWLRWLLANVVGVLAYSLLLPITQWWVLRRETYWVPKTGWWILLWVLESYLASFIGFLAAAIASAALGGQVNSNPFAVLVGIVVFLVVTRFFLVGFEKFLQSRK